VTLLKIINYVLPRPVLVSNKKLHISRRLGRLDRKCNSFEHVELNGGLQWGPRGEAKYFERILEEKEDAC
jgi:hypothetical protein